LALPAMADIETTRLALAFIANGAALAASHQHLITAGMPGLMRRPQYDAV